MENRILAGLEPQKVFQLFEELCQLPHESGNTAAASDWAETFAKNQGLTYRRDEVGNVVIWKAASPGYEDHPTVLLQGHLDMVCVKDNGVEHDFACDPLDLYIEDGFVKARGTSLGGDNGIAVAMTLAILADDSIPHPPVTAVLTIDEEVGLVGASALDCSDLGGNVLLNLDSEEEGFLTVSCAGGARCDITRTFPVEKTEGSLCTLTVSGLLGGHSGVEIHKGLANANKVLGKCLKHLTELGEVRLVSLVGGQQDNAIPKEAVATFFFTDVSAAETALTELEKELQVAYAAADPGLTLTLSALPGSGDALSPADSLLLIDLIMDYPDGVLAMSQDIPGLVQTSLNLGILRLQEGKAQLSSAIRSNVGKEKEELIGRLNDLADQYSAAFGLRGSYPGWDYRKDSRLRDIMCRVYREQYGKEPVVTALHAGLECGLFANRIDDLDAVSIGPDLFDVHSTRERLSIASVERTWQYLLAILAAL